MTIAPVVRAVTVDTLPERAFAIFTNRIVDWWPLATHTSTEQLAADLTFVDGSLVEVSAEGERCTWGTVTEWDPPRRLALTWSPTGGPVTSISVDFEASDGQTRVVLRHDGWQAYGDRAQEYRDGYDGDYAWGWVLDLFAFAAHRASDREAAVGASADGHQASRAVALRRGYEDVALALGRGPLGDPEPGEWNAHQVAGHVTTNAQLMCAVVDDVMAGRPARLHGPDDHAPTAVGRYDGVDLDEAAGDLRRVAAELVARDAGLTDAELATAVSTYIEHHGNPVVDGEMTLGDLFAAEVGYHLPAHVGQIEDLRVTESAAAC